MKRELPATLRVRAAAGDGRTIDGVAVPWNTPITIDGRREQFAPGALEADQVVGRPLRWRHSEPIGVVTDAHDRADGMHVSARIAATRAGDDAVALLREMPDMGLSVGFEERSWTVAAREDVFTITRADLVELSLTDLPAYPTARVTATREDPMNTTDVDVSEPDTAAPETREAVTVSDVSNTELGAQLLELREQMHTLAAAPRAADPGATSDLARYRSLGDYAKTIYTLAAKDADLAAAHVRAFAENVVADNAGVTQPVWVQDVKRLVDRGRPFLSRVGTGALPPTDAVLAWPYYDGTLTALVAEQATELTEVESAEVNIKRATGTVKTYAGGSTISRQLIERSDPAYLDKFMAIMLMAYARVTEATGIAAAEAAATSDIEFDDSDPKYLFTGVVEAAAAIEDATGSGPSVIVCAPSAWATYAAALDGDGRPLFGATNPSNAPGVPSGPGVSAFSVAGIPLVRGVVETTAPLIATNGAAFQWLEDGPRPLQAELVSVLGSQHAVYGYAAAAAYTPAGIATLTPTATP